MAERDKKNNCNVIRNVVLLLPKVNSHIDILTDNDQLKRSHNKSLYFGIPDPQAGNKTQTCLFFF